MKLKYRAWNVIGPNKNALETRSKFPWDMLRYDPAYIHDESLACLLSHSEKGGNRREFCHLAGPSCHDSYIILCTQLPGYKSGIMNPTLGRWASFGWGQIEYAPEVNMSSIEPRHWNTVIGFNQESEPIFLTLQDFIDAKNMDAWSIKVGKTRESYNVR